MLARASVFAGGFRLEAAERVCAGDRVVAGDVLDILDSLVRKSLLNVDPAPDEMRFGPLETIRQFGDAQLVENHEKAAMRRAHARWMADDSDARFAIWRSPRQGEAHVWLDREIGNLRIAFRWAMEHADVDVAARIASNVGDMARHCLRDEATGWADEIVDAARALGHRRLGVLLNWAGSGACAAARYDDARRHAEEALALVGDAHFDPLVWACVDLAFVAMAEGEFDRAIALLARGAADPADSVDRYCAACHLAFMAAVGRVDEARTLMDETLRSVNAAGVPCSIVVAYVGKADALSAIDPPAALAAMEHAMKVARASGCRFLESYFTPRLAVLQARHGDPADALRGLRSLRSAWSASSDAAVIASQRGNLVVVLVRMRRFIEAATLQGTLDGAMQGAALSVYLDDAVIEMRAAMAESDFAQALRQGAAMTPTEADELALNSLRAALAVVGG